jgi:hypothetical protein
MCTIDPIPTYNFCIANPAILGESGGIGVVLENYTPGDFLFEWTGPGGYTNSYTLTLTGPPATTTILVTLGGFYHLKITEVSTGCDLYLPNYTDPLEPFEVIVPSKYFMHHIVTNADCGTGGVQLQLENEEFLTADYLIKEPPYTGAVVASGTITCNDPFTALIPLPAGQYSVTYLFETECTATRPDITVGPIDNSISEVFTITSNPLVITSTVTATIIACDASDGVITLTPTNGTAPYTFEWTGPGSPAYTSTDQSPTGLEPGPYNVVITDANGCTGTNSVTVLCQCFKLTSCSNPDKSYYVSGDLGGLVGYTINGLTIQGKVIDPDKCWYVELPEVPCETTLLFTGYNTFFSDCEHCITNHCVVDPPYERVVPDPVKIFFQIAESKCDIQAIQKFATSTWKKVKELKYGITSCCDATPGELLWLDNEVTRLNLSLIPGYICHTVANPCSWIPLETCDYVLESNGTSIMAIAGESLSLGDLVMLWTDGKVYKNNPLDVNNYQRAIGFVTMNAIINQQVRILVTGIFTNANWTLSTGSIYYAGAAGTITSTVPNTGISQVIGIANSTVTLFVKIEEPIVL